MTVQKNTEVGFHAPRAGSDKRVAKTSQFTTAGTTMVCYICLFSEKVKNSVSFDGWVIHGYKVLPKKTAVPVECEVVLFEREKGCTCCCWVFYV